MKLIQIVVEGNTGSTGAIAEAIGKIALQYGWESYIAHGRFPRSSESEIIKIGSDLDVILHGLETRLFDRHCLGSRKATRELVRKIETIKPDIIHLHHLHGYYINIEILFEYLHKTNIPVVWTFHDCWSFTGHCAHFDFAGCDKWKTECHECPLKKEYPSSWFLDRSKKNFWLKKRLFTSCSKMCIVPVSDWLNKLVKESFFANTAIKTIHNGTDLVIFKPYNNQQILDKYNIVDKFVILGVASPWSKRKGLNDFIKLSEYLRDDETILLVGLSKEQLQNLPKNVIGVARTENRQQLAELYSAADVFVNPTLEDNFPTTNIEALACGTPVITYNTGGSPEAFDLETGIVVEKGSVKGLVEAINEIKIKGKFYYTKLCRKRAEEHFSKEKQFSKYIEMYSEILNKK